MITVCQVVRVTMTRRSRVSFDIVKPDAWTRASIASDFVSYLSLINLVLCSCQPLTHFTFKLLALGHDSEYDHPLTLLSAKFAVKRHKGVKGTYLPLVASLSPNLLPLVSSFHPNLFPLVPSLSPNLAPLVPSCGPNLSKEESCLARGE
jgi:hypothetical protein